MILNFDEQTKNWIEQLAILSGRTIEQYILFCINQTQHPSLAMQATVSKTNDGFEEFWKAYPKKVGPHNAKRAWGKIKYQEGFIRIVLKAIEIQKSSWTERKFIPHPATWLNAGRWMDEEEKELNWKDLRRLENAGR